MDEQKQICSNCEEEKSIDDFYFSKNRNKFTTQCKNCILKKQTEYNQNNKEKIAARKAKHYQNNKEKLTTQAAEYRQNNKEKIALSQAEYRQNNKEKIALRNAEYRQNNKEKIAARKAEYKQNNKEKINEYERNRNKNNENARLVKNIRNRINSALKGKSKSFHTKEILGIDVENYKKWLLFQMTPEMNFNNIHIDHVKPISSFDVTKEEELLEAFNWRNTQPLLKQDNLRKSDKFNERDYNNQFIKAREFNLLQTFLSETNLL